MQELVRIKEAIEPREILLVADAMTGQDAVNVATAFNERLALTGVILTKLDGDARGGAALSIRSVTGKPIKLVGIGEKLDALETFHPDRMAQRILGMGDVLSLIEKAEASIDRDQAAEMAEQLRKDGFTLETFRDQLKAIKKMGSLESLLGMIPGAGKALKQMQGMQMPEKELQRIEAIINSMTPQERRDQRVINGSRRLRIAKGSGTRVQDVNQLLKQFIEAQNMMKRMQKLGPKGLRGLLGKGGGLPF
jgi:signal recognition particle subunit SRP54